VIVAGKASVVNQLDGFKLIDLPKGEIFCTAQTMGV